MITSPTTPEDFSALVKTTELNEILLNSFLNFRQSCGAQQTVEILNRLKRNLFFDKDIRKRTLEEYKRKREYLKKINKNIDLKFPATFLTKEMILNHEATKAILEHSFELINNQETSHELCVDICLGIFALTGSLPLRISEQITEVTLGIVYIFLNYQICF